MILTAENIKAKFPGTKSDKISNILRYQETFNLTLESLKCLNPTCSKMVKIIDWKNQGPSLCCSSECSKIMKEEINKIRLEKGKQTYLEKTGYENAAHNPEAIEKKKQTILANYGVENIFENTEYINQSRLAKTGYSHPSFDPTTFDKKRENCIIKWGTTHQSNRHLVNIDKAGDLVFWQNNFVTSDGFLDFKKAMDFFNCSEFTIRKWFTKFGSKLKTLGRTSLLEKEIQEYSHSLFPNLNIQFNSKRIIPPKELDIFIVDLNLAIEINGLYWHSYSNNSNKNFHDNQGDIDFMKFRHQHKILDCMKKGIRLLHIYEGEDYKSKIDLFLNWQLNNDQLLFDLDSGCYPISSKFQISDPIETRVLNDRILWKAGFMKLEGDMNDING